MLSIITGSVFVGPIDSANASVAAGNGNYEVTGYITPINDLSSVYFLGTYTNYSGETGYFFQNLNSFKGGQTTDFSFTVSYDGYAPTAYTILGLHGVLNDGVTVGSNAIAPGTSWDSLYLDQYTEPTFAGLLMSGAQGNSLETFYANNLDTLGTSMGSSLKLVNFSDATFGGTMSASSVPIPGAVFLFAPGLLSLVAIRRKFKR